MFVEASLAFSKDSAPRGPSRAGATPVARKASPPKSTRRGAIQVGNIDPAFAPSVFQTTEWIETWRRCLGADATPLDLPFHAPQPNLAPLNLAPDRVLRWAGDGKADYGDLADRRIDAAGIRQLLAALMDRADQWDRVELNNIPHGSMTWRLLHHAAPDFGLYALARPIHECPAWLHHGHETETHALVNKYSLRRPVNRLRREGSLACRNITDIDEARQMLDPFFEQHIARWSGTATPSLFHEQRYREFYGALLEALFPKGWLLFSVVELNHQPIAFHYGFDFGGRLTWYKPAFDPAWGKFSPGLVMIQHLLQYTLEHNRAELDFTIGGESFKDRFSNARRVNMQLNLYKHPHQYMAARLRYTARQWAKRVFNPQAPF